MQLISDTLLNWHQEHGRHDLPWQNTQDAYRIWVSEIMLQQTQVTTVIDYYQRFMQRFPKVEDLGAAPEDEVLHYWTGLGYYARARNLHKSAKIISNQYDGVFPTDFDNVIALPGIGRSTAGAILAFSSKQRFPILDGNVKRVLARFYAIEGWYGVKKVEAELWELAEKNTPTQGVDIYTQAIMDFGATLCTRSKPKCEICPLQTNCIAFKDNRTVELPHGKPKKDKPTKQTYMLLIKNQEDAFLLQKNPPSGIWGGLWCPPQTSSLKSDKGDYLEQVEILKELPIYKHTFSHYHLEITPVLCRLNDKATAVNEAEQTWYMLNSEQQLGLAAPVKKLLECYA
ncbi:MAG: A/G-specific adenine glycosylase [Gammaproteobacteria bacterium]|nr:A/G-specific adenine glycosylase [Gammaproteobacteria bacterium]